MAPYKQLAEILRARLKRGDFGGPNRPIPSEPRLVQEYGLARSTVRRSVAILVEEGLVYTVPQRGSYVAGK
ncbi:GntR family transcriptional regulator [Actinopolymorpha pittospori]|uniref:GntR family transcriptional regulator n=1 Tax=Actinopolymorpha pittospori TaxID=648752 RepID=UPI0031EEE56F